MAISSRSAERIEAAAAEIASETGAEVHGFAADTEAVEELPALVERVRADLGPVDILVTNTGGPPLGDTLRARGMGSARTAASCWRRWR